MACTVKGSIFGETWLMLPIVIHFEDFDKLSEVQMIDPQILNSHPDGTFTPAGPHSGPIGKLLAPTSFLMLTH